MEPKCPKCEVSGRDHMKDQESLQKSKGGNAWFEIVYCGNCGHVYGVFPKHVLTIDVTPSTPMPSVPFPSLGQ